MGFFQRRCYNVCVVNDFNENVISSFAQKYGISVQDVIDNAFMETDCHEEHTLENLKNYCFYSRNGKWVADLKKKIDAYPELKKLYVSSNASDVNDFYKMLPRLFYEFSFEHNFSPSITRKYAESIGFDYTIFKNKVRSYAMNDLHTSVSFAYDKLEIWLNTNENRRAIFNLLGGADSFEEYMLKLEKYCFEYALSVNNDKDSCMKFAYSIGVILDTFDKYVLNYCVRNGINKDDLFLNRKNEIVQKDFLASRDVLISFIKDFDDSVTDVDNLSILRLDSLTIRIIYDYFKANEYDITCIKHLEDRYGFSYKKILKRIENYQVSVLGHSDMLISSGPLINFISENDKRRRLFCLIGGNSYKEFKYKLYEYCYNYGLSVNFNDSYMEMEAIKYGLTLDMFKFYIEMYTMLGYSNMLVDVNRLRDIDYRDEINRSSVEYYKSIYLKIKKYDDRDVDLDSREDLFNGIERCLYLYGKSVNFDKLLLEDICNKCNISFYIMKEHIIRYVTCVLGFSSREVNAIFTNYLKDEFRFDFHDSVGNNEAKKKIFSKYRVLDYNEYRFITYRECFNYGRSVLFKRKALQDYSIELGFRDNIVSTYARKYYYEYLGLSLDDWKEMISSLSDEKKEKEINLFVNDFISKSYLRKRLFNLLGADGFYDKYIDFVYKICLDCEFDINSIISECFKYDLSFNDVVYAIRRYASKNGIFLNHKIDLLYKKRKILVDNVSFINGCRDCLLEIYFSKDVSELEEIFKKYYEVDIESLMFYYDYFVKFFYLGKKTDMIRAKLVKYREYIDTNGNVDNKKRSDNEALANAVSNYICGYINSEFISVSDYCSSINISVEFFDKMVRVCEIVNPDLYNKYCERENDVRDMESINLFREIIMLINNGVKTNKGYRDFDLLDYYMMTKINLNKAMSFVKKNFSSDDSVIFYTFCEKYKRLGSTDVEEVIDVDIIINNKHFSLNERKAIIEYMNDNKIPFSYKLFLIVARRYANQDEVVSEYIKKKIDV